MIRLVPMTEAEYSAFYEYAIRDYAEGLVRAGTAHSDLAVQVSQQQCAPVLSDGLASPNQRFYTIREETVEARHVGYLWWGIVERYGTRSAMLYFVGVFEPYRRRGYATQALRLLEERTREEGLGEIRLYVFGHNAGAWALYRELGYAPVSLTMAKQVGQVD
jgi:ribosomal protein S18 acetylase RimI-like enzyme